MLTRRFAVGSLTMAIFAGSLIINPLAARGDDTVVFTGSARIVASNIASADTTTSATDLSFIASCPDMPPAQDVDAHVFELPSAAPDNWTATVVGDSALGFYDLDFLFYAADCEFLDQASTAEVDETAAVPSGTKFVEVVAFFGFMTDATLTVSEAAAPSPTPSVTGSPTPSPSPTEEVYARHHYPLAPSDPLFPDQWNLQRIHAPEAWQVDDTTGFGIVISDVDSGLDLGHPDFDCPGKVIVMPGSDTGNNDDDPQDTDGHGTHVQGIAAACADNAEGVAGVAPDAQLLPVKYDGDIGLTPADLDEAMAKGINFATQHGAHVINLSIGDIPPFSHLGPDGYPETEDAMAAAREAGVVIAAAAGNFDQPTCEYPSLSRNVICVVATDRDDQRSDYSDFAVNFDRNADEPGLEPVVAAPGGGGFTAIPCNALVLSTYLRGAEGSCSDDTGYDWLSGTSMAAPHVAGLAALLYDRLGGVRSKANADLIVETIVATVDDLGAPGWDPLFGSGRINALRAVQALPPRPAI